MHSLFIFGVLLHATALAVLGFFVLFAADRATGRTQTIGKLLGGWLLLLAVLVLIGGGFAVASGRVPERGWMGGHYGTMMGNNPQRWMMGNNPQGWTPPGPPAADAPAPEAAPANAAAPAAAK